MGRVIIVLIQHPTPFYDDSYAANSQNNGPYGDALWQGLVPRVEQRDSAGIPPKRGPGSSMAAQREAGNPWPSKPSIPTE